MSSTLVQLWAALSRARRYSKKIAVFLGHLATMRFAENNLHPFN
ncbi:MAG: hypothetical protein ACJ71Q_14220 [Terriglobales bacterium]